jgi:hypothetical protein
VKKRTLCRGAIFAGLVLTSVAAEAAWDPIAQPDPAKRVISAVAVNPKQPNLMWVGYSDGSLFWTTQGRSGTPAWSRVDVVNTPGAPSLPDRRITSIALNMNDAQTAYVGFAGFGNSNMWKTSTGGQFWQNLSSPELDWGGSVRGISVNPDNSAKIYVNFAYSVVASEDAGETWFSPGWDPPGHSTWSKIAPADPTAMISAITVAPGNLNEVWVGFSNGEIYQTMSAQQETPTWSRVDTTMYGQPYMPHMLVAQIAMPPVRNEGEVYVAYSEDSLESAGDVWFVTATPSGWGKVSIHSNLPKSTILGVAANQSVNGILYVPTEDGVLGSSNGGASWTFDDRTLRVLYHPGDGMVADNHVKPHLQILNAGNNAVPLSELEIRYYYSIDGQILASEQATVDYAKLGNQHVVLANRFNSTGGPAQPPSDADHYLSVKFDDAAGSLAAGQDTGEIQTRFNKVDWSNYDETNDHSYSSNTSYADSWSVALFRNGQRVWGIRP